MFKLVRIDDEHHQEIPLLDGKQVIGRNDLPHCDDKRVSRSHAEIEILADSIIIKALHINPCFIVKNTMGEAHVIRQNSTMKIMIGDKIAFTNDNFFYYVVNKENNNISVTEKDCQSIKDIINKHTNLALLYKDDSDKEENSTDKSLNKSTDEQQTNKTDLTKEAPPSPSILTNVVTQELQLNNNELKTQEEADNCLSQSPGKRGLLKREPTSPVDIKKVKTEGNAEDTPQDSGSGVSTSGASSASGSSSPKDQTRKRERCMYGVNCYRKNPQHKAQFSHPGDADWGTGAQAPCPWGYACARSDPRHWRDHSHPYGMHPPPPAGLKKRKTHIVQRNGRLIYINANAVNFYDDHFDVEDSDGDSVDYDYEFD